MFDREEQRLYAALGRLTAELEESSVPPEIESAVLAEFDRVRRHRRARLWVAGAGAVAAAAVGLWMTVNRPTQKPADPVEAVAPEGEQPFVPIPYVLPPAPYERVEVVRMQVPVAALIAAGLPIQTGDPGAQAEADVLVGQDGRPGAVRLVSIISFN